jgi:hypothetical protein
VILIIVLDTLTNFRRSHSNDRVGVRVVVGWPVKDFHTKDALFELVGLSGQRSRYYKS